MRFRTVNSRGFAFVRFKYKNEAHKALERFDSKILYQFMHLVIRFDKKALVFLSGRDVLSFKLLVLSFTFRFLHLI